MDPKTLVRHSRFLSLVLRHKPQEVGIALEDGGWVSVDVLLAALAAHGRKLKRAELDQIVAGNDKQRFAFSGDGKKIRASQGHSVDVDLRLEQAAPPAVLYHGTARDRLRSISVSGLLKGKRHHVHLSAATDTATKVGARHGEAVVLPVRAGEMAADGHVFYRSANGVWLTDAVPPRYIDWAAKDAP